MDGKYFQVLRSLQETEDINSVADYFSYEHFYVIYCKFWEIDRDHDLIIDKTDLARHDGGGQPVFLCFLVLKNT